MKHRSSSHSLNPARMQARTQSRQVARVSSGPPAAAPDTGGWRVLTREDGALVARHLSGAETVLATPPDTDTTTTIVGGLE